MAIAIITSPHDFSLVDHSSRFFHRGNPLPVGIPPKGGGGFRSESAHKMPETIQVFRIPVAEAT